MSSVWLNPSLANAASMASASALERVAKPSAKAPVAETPADASSYWSISTTMRPGSLSAGSVQEANEIAAAVTDTAALGLEQATDIVARIQQKLVLAKAVGADREAINADIQEMKTDLGAVVSESSFNGDNWLAVEAGGRPKVASLLASVTTGEDGGLSINMVDFDTAKSTLISRQEAKDGMLTRAYAGTTLGGVPYNYYLMEAGAREPNEAGAREITLLGQNVNAWSGEDDKGRRQGFAGLIHALAAIDGLERIRYTTSHPMDMDEALIAAHGEVAKLMPYLHLPVQSGNDRVLKAMNRSHTAEGYLRLLERFRAVRPDIALSGDFIVGFPGESEAEFADTLALVDEVKYAQAFSFKYSARPGTPAATMDGQIVREVMDDRLQRLQAALNRDQLAFNQASFGKTCEVLVERKGKYPGQWLGKSPWLQSVWFEADCAIGDLVTVELAEAGPNSLRGIPKVAALSSVG